MQHCGHKACRGSDSASGLMTSVSKIRSIECCFRAIAQYFITALHYGQYCFPHEAVTKSPQASNKVLMNMKDYWFQPLRWLEESGQVKTMWNSLYPQQTLARCPWTWTSQAAQSAAADVDSCTRQVQYQVWMSGLYHLKHCLNPHSCLFTVSWDLCGQSVLREGDAY